VSGCHDLPRVGVDDDLMVGGAAVVLAGRGRPLNGPSPGSKPGGSSGRPASARTGSRQWSNHSHHGEATLKKLTVFDGSLLLPDVSIAVGDVEQLTGFVHRVGDRGEYNVCVAVDSPGPDAGAIDITRPSQ
jgi:hypothetical protein